MGIVLTIVLSLVLVTALATFGYRAWRQSHRPQPRRPQAHHPPKRRPKRKRPRRS